MPPSLFLCCVEKRWVVSDLMCRLGRWELLDCGRRLREEGDPRAGFISINDGGATLMTVRFLSSLCSTCCPCVAADIVQLIRLSSRPCSSTLRQR